MIFWSALFAPRCVLYLYPFYYTHEVQQLLTQGVACCTPNCTVQMHTHCLATFRLWNTACPSCSKAWPKDKPLTPVGEEADSKGDDRKSHIPLNSMDDSEDDNATQEHPSNSPPRPRKGSRLHKQKNNAQDSGMEVDNE